LDFFGRAEFEAAADAVRQRTTQQPRVGLVLGSGLGDLAESVQGVDVIPYQEIPHWPRSTVIGHRGQLHIGMLESVPVMVMRGRAHYYEGYSMTQVTLPIRVMQLLGIEVLILTNAAGGLNQSFTPGDLMLLVDHLNLIGMTGANPLRGPNDETLGTRFPDMTRVYDRDLRSLAAAVAAEQGLPLHQGVYICLAGPSFETPADVRFLRTIGADAVGMSTVPEATVARHGGLRVMGVSSIANIVIDDPDSDAVTTHEEVLAAGALAVPRLEALVRGVLRGLD
jgi:purine-nucleoside phosphorylase